MAENKNATPGRYCLGINLPPAQARFEFNNERQIDGGATFYTDHAFLMNLLTERESNEG